MGACSGEGELKREANEVPKERYPVHEDIIATIFYIGEKGNDSNGGISNEQLAWDSDPVARFGAIDDPNNPPETVNHTRYYAALPVHEYTSEGLVSGIRGKSPWAERSAEFRL